MEESQKRQVAFKVSVKEIVEGKYVTEEGWQPNYVVSNSGKKISRVNLIGTIVLKANGENLNYESIVLDDGSGKISVRSFDEKNPLQNSKVGDTILIIGKPRQYGQEKYIVPEIIKKIEDRGWAELRKTELGEIIKNVPERKEESPSENGVLEEVTEQNINPNEKILRLVKELDVGAGADVQELINKTDLKEAEKIIKTLLEQGEIFEIKPGKLKILE